MQRNPELVSPATQSYHCSASTSQIMDPVPRCICWHRCLWYGNVLRCLAWKVINRPYSNRYVNFRARSLIILNKTIQQRMQRRREKIAAISWPSIRLEATQEFPSVFEERDHKQICFKYEMEAAEMHSCSLASCQHVISSSHVLPSPVLRLI